MLVKTLLNKRYPLKSHVYEKVECAQVDGEDQLLVTIVPRSNGQKTCSNCQRVGCPGYDTLKPRQVEFVPMLGMKVYFCFTPRRVNCPWCGPTVEALPWVNGKSTVSIPLMLMFSFWAKLISYTGVAKQFGATYKQVFEAVEYVVSFGLQNRVLSGITAIGVDEIQVKLGHVYMTLVYQIDNHCRRLLWMGEGRTEEVLDSFFDLFSSCLSSVQYVCSDMWRPYLNVIKSRLPTAVNILDRFHIVQNLNKAMDQVRREETRDLKAKGYEPHLTGTRWCFLKNACNLTSKQAERLKETLKYNLKSTKAYLLKEDFQRLWSINQPARATKFIDQWCSRVMYSKIEPMKKFARSMRRHKPLILNYFKAKKQFSSGAVEGMNSFAKLAMRKSFGFKTKKALKITLFHQLGDLPEPQLTHKLW